MCELYKMGYSAPYLGKLYGVSAVAICGLLKRRGIPRRSRSDYKEFTCNFRYFAQVDTEDKAYWLGFIAAYISRRRNLEHASSRKALRCKGRQALMC
jgi:hypothetical protein